MKPHLKIGVTGGIGSGKSTVCSIFSRLGIPIYKSDERAKILMVENKTLNQNIRKTFGWDSYTDDNEVNRSYLAKVVFNNAEKLAQLNALVHPIVFEDFAKWVIQYRHLPYSIKEAALMFETDSYKQMDQIIVVSAPIQVRIERIVKRDNVRHDDVLKRINNQLSDKERISRANYSIINDGKKSLIEQVLALHKLFSDI